MKLRLHGLVLMGMIAAAPQAALAAWPTNATSAVVVSATPGDQVLPEIATLADGGYYVAWIDSYNNGYDVRLQRFDRNGNALWAPNGILVADRSLSYETHYDLDRDAAGNAVLAYRYPGANGKLQVAVSKIAPDGTAVWGRVFASADASDVVTADVAVTADGGTVVAWLNNSTGLEVLQKLDATGQALWGAGVVVVAPSGAFSYPADLQGSGNDVIASFVIQGRSTSNQLWAQKYDAAGQPLWSPNYVKLWDNIATGFIPQGYAPEFKDDGAGGAVFCWQYVPNTTGSHIQAQHILADGSELYPHNGVALSTDVNHTRTNVDCSYDAKTGDIYALWRENGDTADYSGIYAQRVDTNGSLLWGGVGQVLVPVNLNTYSELNALPARNGGFIAGWTQDSVSNDSEPLFAAAIKSNGQAAWRNPIVQYKQFDGEVRRVIAAPTRVGGAVFVWENNPPHVDGETDLMMQKVGAFGGVGSPGN